MASEPSTTRAGTLPPRASIAMLTLQLRAVLREAEAAEAEADAIDLEAAREQLRARLAPLLDERRRALEEELASVRAEAAAAIAAAHQAVETVEQVEAVEAVDDVAPVAMPEPDPEPQLEPQLDHEPDPERMPEELRVDVERELDVVFRRPSADAAQEDAPRDDAPRVDAVAQSALGSPVHLHIDAEAFARVFATVFASVMEERLAHLPQPSPTPLFAPAVPATPKSSFWSGARHLDVFLLGLATVIVLVVIAAWMA